LDREVIEHGAQLGPWNWLDRALATIEAAAMPGQYTFGDTELAARRLALLAEVFEPTTRPILEAALGTGRASVVDLGCGPGYTTRLLADTCRPESVLGIDSSERFVALARQLHGRAPAVDFAVHDVTALPLPRAPVDGLYARLLLAHLPDPRAVAERWRSQLRPGGVAVLEEVETILVPPGVLQDYLRLVAERVATSGAVINAGPELAPLGGRCVELPVPVPAAARMFGMNLATWRDDAVRQGQATEDEVDAMAAGLADLAGLAEPAESATWVMRQLVLPA